MSSQLAFDEAQLLEFAKSIELAATYVLEGMHHSVRGGEGMEFHSATPYSEGEDARRIDWKRFAASDRYYVNRFKREEKASWIPLVDSSPSMNYGQKSLWARRFAGIMLYLAKVWGDRWRLLPEGEFIFDEALSRLATGKDFGCSPRDFSKFQGDANSRLIVLSDGFFPERYFERDFHRWEEEFQSIILVQILDPREIDFDFSGVLQFEDMESSERLILDTKVAKRKYQHEFKKHQQFLNEIFSRKGFIYSLVAGKEPIEQQALGLFERL